MIRPLYAPGTANCADKRFLASGHPADPRLTACRDLALQLLIQSFDGFFDHLEDEFLNLAEKAIDRNLRDTYFAARVETQSKRDLIKSEFHRRFLDAFDTRLQDTAIEQNQIRRTKHDPSAAELSLVANDDFEESLTASSVASAIESGGGEDLKQLESRLSSLLPLRENETAANPISPEAICEALLGACRQIESGVAARIVALRSFEQQLNGHVSSIYKQVNEFLVQQNVPPAARRSLTRSAASTVQAASDKPPVQSSAPDPAQPEMVQVSVPATLAAHLDLLLKGQTSAAPVQPFASFAGETSFLDQLQHRMPDGVAELDGIAIHAARDNLVALLQNSQWGQALSQMDAMTLSLVALLFDRLFEDSRLPLAIRGLIGRLQIPVLKVALRDSSFFARKQHPARQLLDRLAEAAVDWHDGADIGNPRFDKFSAIVSWVVTHFDNDVSVFSQALDKLDAFLQEEAAAAASQIQKDAEILAANELGELGMAAANRAIRLRLLNPDIPPLVTQFLQQWWSAALAKAYGPDGENEPRFVAYRATMDDLLWSLEPKCGTEARLQLVNFLPGMLKTLEEGTALAGMPADDCTSFFSELVHCHAAAIRHGTRLPASHAADLEAVVPAILPELSELEPVEEVPAAPLEEVPLRWEWVELRKNDGSVQKLRLTWISPKGTQFLFTNREGENGHTFNRAEVKKLMRAGRMRREQLPSSLTDDVLNQLRQALVA